MMEFGEVLSQFVIQVIFPLLGALILSLIGILLRKLAQRFEREELMDYQSKIEDLAISAIGFAEEWASSRIKSSVRTTGNEKLDKAATWLMTNAPEVKRDQAKLWIEAMLARVEGAGATGSKVIE
jgi:hypothetical protein